MRRLHIAIRPLTWLLIAIRFPNGRLTFLETTHFGPTWTKIVNGIPQDDFLRAIREDTVRTGLLYLGTERGVYISFNDRASWQRLKLNLPVTPVHDLVSEKQDLVVSTHGRGFYLLDNMDILRQLSPEVVKSDAFLFQPAMQRALSPVASRPITT